MADTIRQIPEKYAAPEHVFHPRLSSYGRRLWAALPPLLLVAAATMGLFYRRPAGSVAGLLILLALLGGLTAYGYLRPALAVITQTYFLKSRWIGFHAVARPRVSQVVTVERLLPPRPREGAARGRPYLWLVSDTGQRLMTLDGIVWDAGTLARLAQSSGAQHVNFKQATPAQVSEHWPRLVSWQVRYPRLRYAASSVALLVLVALVVWLSVTRPGV